MLGRSNVIETKKIENDQGGFLRKVRKMELKILKEKIQDLFEANKIKRSLSLLKQELSRESEKYSDYISIRRRFNEVQDDKMADTIDFSTANTALNKIGQALLNFINTLEEVDLETKKQFLHQEISNSILVFTEYESPEKLKDFFNQLNFKDVSVYRTIDFEEVRYNEFDLIIFDNRDLPTCYSKKDVEKLDPEIQKQIHDRIAQMDLIIKESSKFLIHYGNILYWINSNRERVQAANSKFSLYARTKEVIEFINTYRI